jgi:hypothetical protein
MPEDFVNRTFATISGHFDISELFTLDDDFDVYRDRAIPQGMLADRPALL